MTARLPPGAPLGWLGTPQPPAPQQTAPAAAAPHPRQSAEGGAGRGRGRLGWRGVGVAGKRRDSCASHRRLSSVVPRHAAGHAHGNSSTSSSGHAWLNSNCMHAARTTATGQRPDLAEHGGRDAPCGAARRRCPLRCCQGLLRANYLGTAGKESGWVGGWVARGRRASHDRHGVAGEELGQSVRACKEGNSGGPAADGP